MRLIEADKVEQAIKDYWKAYVDRMPTPYSTEEFEKFANRAAMCFEHRDELLKEIKALPSVQPEPCKDAVSREAVLSMIDTYMNKSVELHYLPTSDGIKKLISILPSAQPERKTGRWIPVTERLPQEGEVVLTQAKFKDDVKMAVSSRIDYNYWTTWGTRDINIIAWMPLPEPYQEGGEQS